MNDIFSLADKHALITGATGHLGNAMAKALARRGATIHVNARSVERCTPLVDDIRSEGWRAEPAVFDVNEAAEVNAFFAAWDKRPLHILINNAYKGAGGTIETAEPQDYIDSYNIAVAASHRLLRASLSSLRLAARGCGDASVINVSSMYGMVSPDQRNYASAQGTNPPFYGAAKAALIQWSRYAACEFGKENIRINALSLGPFPSIDVQRSDRAFIRALADNVPMGKIGQAEEITGPVVFLASPASCFVNGANLVVDGGWTAW